MENFKREKIVFLTSFFTLLAAAIFATGFAFSQFAIWPTKDLILLSQQIRAYHKTGQWGLVEQFLPAEVEAGQPRYMIRNADAFQPGFRAILGHDADLNLFSVRLFDQTGRQVHVWPIDHLKLSGKSEYNDAIIPHGMEVVEDGSIVVNFDRFVGVMSRIDACGEPIWTQKGLYHHSIHRGDDDSLWTWYSPDHPSGQQQSIVKMDLATGDVLQEISLEEVGKKSAQNAMILGVQENFTPSPSNKISENQHQDIFHPNDVEPLSAELAPFFDMFEVGDLLISLRNLNLVAVLDPETLAFKWARYGPWIRQHDPDFTRKGTIDIYDNASRRGRSHIVSVDVKTGVYERLFGVSAPAFYSRVQGKHQRLPSGAHLITVPKEGRVLEISETGEMVSEYNNIAGDGANGTVLNAIWIPEDYFSELPNCSED